MVYIYVYKTEVYIQLGTMLFIVWGEHKCFLRPKGVKDFYRVKDFIVFRNL